jgi:preprotein translocase subunit YajC
MNEVIYSFLAQQSAGPAAAPAGAPQGDLMQQFGPIIMMVVIFGFMWFFVIRPQRKEEKRRREMIDAIKKGDSIVTSGGIVGTIFSMKDDIVTLKVGEGTKMDVMRNAIAQVRNGTTDEKVEEKKDEKKKK